MTPRRAEPDVTSRDWSTACRAKKSKRLSYTLPYLSQIVQSRGKDLTIGKDVLPAKDRLRFRDADWWLDSEKKKMTFESPAPWNQKGG